MDDIDKNLISILQKNGRTSLSDIGKKLGMSHVAVSKRLDKLVGSNLVQITAGVNTEYLDTKIFFMGLETENMEVAERIQEDYKNCPRLLMLAPVTGRYNIFAVMIAEDTWSLESIIGTCSIRTEPGVRRSESWFGNAPIYPQFIPLDLAPATTGSPISPCGRNCGTCKRYVANKCMGCPQTSVYRGKLWASPVKVKKRRKSKS
ncbi:MAG: Lrp/AsnC family transcriptional regulator [Candidatus Thorarchaeota archaeon]|nr:MAG: Lrp/AsnC family transcriptional regulator [Candidatus Thorarchaeota archaeon]